MRLRKVTRSTVAKELSALRNFLGWAERRHEIDEAPLVRNPPRRSTGTAFEGGKRDKVRVPLTSEQAEAIIDLLPERTRWPAIPSRPCSPSSGIRASASEPCGGSKSRSTTSAETTCSEISQDIDKSRYARALPLTPRARRAVLDAICPDEGLIFRRFEYRRILVQAARKVLATEHEAKPPQRPRLPPRRPHSHGRRRQ